MFKRPLVIWLLLLVGINAVALWWFQGPIAVEVARRVATHKMNAHAIRDLPDGLHVGLCGAGSPFPDDLRSGPCTLVVAGKRLLVFDAGTSSARQIGRMGFWLGDIEAVLLTHFHSDHIGGLGELMLQRWLQGGHAKPLPVHGPVGVAEVVHGFDQAYRQDQGYRVEHHGDKWLPAAGFGATPVPFALPEKGTVTVLKEGDLEVVAFAVNHAPIHPAVGYRIRYKDRTVVLSGDTTANDQVLAQSKGVDVLVHEALSPSLVRLLSDVAQQSGKPVVAKLLNDVLDYHATPEEAAQTARDAQVRFLVLNHIVPTLPPLPGMEKVFLGRARDIFKGPIQVGVDGDFVSLPSGGTTITWGNRL